MLSSLPCLLQLSCLTRLSALRLKDSYWHLDRFAVLKQLPALRKLVLHSPLYPVFDCLGELTQIEDLVRGRGHGSSCLARDLR